MAGLMAAAVVAMALGVGSAAAASSAPPPLEWWEKPLERYSRPPVHLKQQCQRDTFYARDPLAVRKCRAVQQWDDLFGRNAFSGRRSGFEAAGPLRRAGR
ncbi:MAG: hypothetical protein LDL26_00350 [Caenispirillum bisanense]|nr:hypothetical protein [Caenispirillum bisanense]